MTYEKHNLNIYLIIILFIDKLTKIKYLKVFLTNCEYLWIQFVGSNHVKRLPFLISSKLNKIFFIKIFGINFYEQYKISKIYPSKNVNNINDFVVFIGDSHVEFYSRINTSKLRKNPLALHLGAVTLIGIDSLKKSNLNYIISFLKKVILNNESKNFKIVWSFGSIDIRSSIYELRLRNVISEYDDIYSIILKSLKSLDNKICIINKSLRCNNVNHYLITPTISHENNIIPKNLSELIYLRKKQEILSLGNRDDHIYFLNTFIDVLKGNSFNNINYIENNANLLDKKLFFDGIHITCANTIKKIYQDILNL